MDDAQSVLSAPEEESAAQAFARLDGRIAMMARAVEHLAAERASIDIPDYSPTLAQMNTRLAAVAQALAAIAEKPAMQLTPEGLAARMDAAGEKSRATDRATLQQARTGHQEAVRTIREVAVAVRSTDEQRKCIAWAAGGGLVVGCLLWSILSGVILRTLPAGWHMPEAMAAHIVGELSLWDAGARMMRADYPDAWQTIIVAARIQRKNHDAIVACEQVAANTKRPVPCVIRITDL